MPKKFKLLLDTSVLISGLNSSLGASAKILSLAKENKISILVTFYILDEIEKVIEEKLPRLKAPFVELETEWFLQVCKTPSLAKIKKAAAIISDPKDAPILASAIHEKVDYLITLDRKDFIDDPQVSKKSRVKILTPGSFVKLFRKNHAKK